MINQVFGELTVLQEVLGPRGGVSWLCLCSCGVKKVIKQSTLTAIVGRRAISCGHVRDSGSVGYKHGWSKTRLYHCWQSMKDRANNTRNPRHFRWGGRGIKIEYELWITDFVTFRDWALTSGYADNLTLERRDNSKGYSPDNCYWATSQQQANNTRRNVLLTAFGETKNVRWWARDARCWVSEALLYVRARTSNMTPEEMITRPVGRTKLLLQNCQS